MKKESQITIPKLEQHLAKAAWILKGPVDAADFKIYIFPLLFFKRISDVYDEEYKKILKESDGDNNYAELEEFHRFIIPEGCHWDDVRSKTTNVGQALQHSFREIEKTNQQNLYGIFGDAPWTNKEKLSDALLIDLIEHFSKINLSNSCVDPDILGQAYEYLIKQFADITNKKAGEFYTPRSVVSLMGKIIDPKEGESVYDPACGTGGMLLECVNSLKKNNKDSRTLKIYGQEKNLTTSSIARINMFLHGLDDFNIVRGDTLRNPAFYDGDKLATFDCVIANPPFSLEKWGDDLWVNDPYGRNFAGTPPIGNGDFAWVQHMIKSMSYPNGRIAVVLSHGVLSRKGREAAIRKSIIKMDILEAVIGLGPNIFYGTNISTCILVFRVNKLADKKNKILFIDASNQIRTGRAQNYLEDQYIDQIFKWDIDYKNIENYTQVIDLKEIKKNNYTLHIPTYVKKVIIDNTPSLKKISEQLFDSTTEIYKAEKKIKELLRNF